MRRRLVVTTLGLALAGCASLPRGERAGDAAWAPPRPVVEDSAAASTGSLFQPGTGLALFVDQRARQVGDVVTVNLIERTDAAKQSSTSSAHDSSLSLPSGTLFGRPLGLDSGLSGNQAFDGKGESSQSNRLSGSITVTVHAVMPNGNLLVRGEKWVTLNQGEEFIRVAGMLRPRDIGPDNAVASFKLADARITYSGKGTLADANRIGWLARLFQIISPL